MFIKCPSTPGEAEWVGRVMSQLCDLGHISNCLDLFEEHKIELSIRWDAIGMRYKKHVKGHQEYCRHRGKANFGVIYVFSALGREVLEHAPCTCQAQMTCGDFVELVTELASCLPTMQV